MRIFKDRLFDKWANKGITDKMLCAAVVEMENGVEQGRY